MLLILVLGIVATVGVVLMLLAVFVVLDDLATEVEDEDRED